MNLLACDLGGTKVLLGIYEKGDKNNPPKEILKEHYLSSEWDSFYLILDDFLNQKCRNIVIPKIACFGIAGPIDGNHAKITNLNWSISKLKLEKSYNFQKVELINDFAILIYGIPYIYKNQFKTIQEGKFNNISNNSNLHSIIGAGTGLGVSRGIISEDKVISLPSEGGHIEFSPKSKEEWEIKEWLKIHLKLNRVSAERIISGQGLSNIAKWRFTKNDAKNHPFYKFLREADNSSSLKKILPSKICQMSSEGDNLMQEIEKIWLDAYSSFLGDIAIHELCYGGLWIAGGTAPKHIDNFSNNSFLEQFSDKGRLKEIVNSIPIRVIVDDKFGLYSAACRAKMLFKNTSK